MFEEIISIYSVTVTTYLCKVGDKSRILSCIKIQYIDQNVAIFSKGLVQWLLLLLLNNWLLWKKGFSVFSKAPNQGAWSVQPKTDKKPWFCSTQS